MKKKKILLIGYGGTIVMIVKGNKVIPADNVEEILDLVPRIKEQCNLDFKFLSNVDSTNVMPSDWENMSKCLIENRDDYDGFIIAHGTNTMAYSGVAVSLALGKGFNKPVVFTGSQLPLTVYGNDGNFNLENSVKVILEAIEKKIVDVMIVFSYQILCASRTVKVSESSFSAFDSPVYPHIGSIKSTGVFFNDMYVSKENTKIPFEPKNKFKTGVVSIDLTPGQDPFIVRSVLNNRSCLGLLLKSHGAGSVPTIGDSNYIPLIKEATNMNLPVLIATKFIGGNSYKKVNDEPAVRALEAGGIPTGDLTDVAAEVKLMWLLGQGFSTPNAIKKKLLENYVGEITPFSA